MKEFVVYTVIVGDYDEVRQPLVIDDRFDYVLFSDTHTEKRIGVWQVRSIPYETTQNYKKARFPRLQPEVVLPEYKAWLYHDGNIQITSYWTYDRFVELFNSDVEWAGIKHQWRNNVYEEMDWMIKAKWVHDYDAMPWYCVLKNERYVKQDYLYETGIIFRRHTGNVKKVNDIWWWSVDNFVRRDQFSIMYAMWKVPEIKMGFFLPETENVWNNGGHFQYTSHNPHKRELSLSIWEKIRHRCFRAKFGNDASYTILLDQVCTRKKPSVALQLWTLGALFTQGWKVILQMIKCRLPQKA